MYKKLITSTDKDVYTLLSYCLKHRTSLVTANSISKLSKKLNYSKTKLISILENAILFSDRYPSFKIQIENGSKEFKIYFYPDFLLSKVYSLMLKDTVGYQFLDSIFKNKYISIEKSAKQFYLSDRTVQRKIKEITDILSNYDISIDLKTKKILHGDEYRIRYFFHIMYWQVYDEATTNYENIKPDSLIALRKKISEKFPYLRHIDIEKYIHILFVSVQRIKKGYTIQKLPEIVLEFKNPYISFTDFRNTILQEFVLENYLSAKISPFDFTYLYYMFSAITTYSISDLEQNNILIKEAVNCTKFSNFHEHFLELFQYQYNLSFSENEKIYLLLNLNVINSVSSVFPSQKKVDPFGRQTNTKDLAKYFPETYYKIESVFFKAIDKFPEFLSLYSGNARLFFQYSMLFTPLLENKPFIVPIYLESKFGKIQESFQRKKMKQLFDERIIFVESNPKIVITDYPVDKSRFSSNKNTCFLQWDSFQTDEDWIKLSHLLENIRLQETALP